MPPADQPKTTTSLPPETASGRWRRVRAREVYRVSILGHQSHLQWGLRRGSSFHKEAVNADKQEAATKQITCLHRVHFVVKGMASLMGYECCSMLAQLLNERICPEKLVSSSLAQVGLGMALVPGLKFGDY
jgi:hypothetical protein